MMAFNFDNNIELAMKKTIAVAKAKGLIKKGAVIIDATHTAA